jgi:hypothetical protein
MTKAVSNREMRRAQNKLNKITVVRENVDRTSFSYKDGDKTALNFNLRTDIPDELLSFKVLMEDAMKDIDEKLKRFNPI